MNKTAGWHDMTLFCCIYIVLTAIAYKYDLFLLCTMENIGSRIKKRLLFEPFPTSIKDLHSLLILPVDFFA